MSIAIVLASGFGRRMASGKNKLFLSLGRKPIIYYSLAAFERSSAIGSIVVTARSEELADFRNVVKKYGFKKVRAIIAGGATRQDSAASGLAYAQSVIGRSRNPVVLFHNGANPFVTAQEISRSIEGARKHGACVVAHRATDTIKEVDPDGIVVRTLERKTLWSMQTPQAIQYRLAQAAFHQAQVDGHIGSDDVSLVERIQSTVKVIEASAYNFKITHPIDLELANLLLRKKHV